MSTDPPAYGDPSTRARILDATWVLVARGDARVRLVDVAEQAGVSRQALYLHFGDRTGLLLALVEHMDQALELDVALAEVHAASSGAEVLERSMRLNTEFWAAVRPVARVLEAGQHQDDALHAAWRDRMRLRRGAFGAIVDRVASLGALDDAWTAGEAAEILYGVAHFDTWRELTEELGWSDDRYVEAMTRLLCRSLLRPEAAGTGA